MRRAKPWLFMPLVGMATMLVAAPMKPLGPFDVAGDIEETQWFPQVFIKGLPGMSGSAGVDRIFPAHFKVKLKNYSGVDSQNAALISRFVRWPGKPEVDSQCHVLVQVNQDDPHYLKSGMGLRLDGYTVAGDEGTLWFTQKALHIAPSPVQR